MRWRPKTPKNGASPRTGRIWTVTSSWWSRRRQVWLNTRLPRERYVTPFLLAQLARWSLTLNPFFDGDGYWLLSDALRVPNLRTYARQRLAEGRRDVFSLYALGSLILGALSLVGLLLLLWNLLGNLALSLGLLGA